MSVGHKARESISHANSYVFKYQSFTQGKGDVQSLKFSGKRLAGHAHRLAQLNYEARFHIPGCSFFGTRHRSQSGNLQRDRWNSVASGSGAHPGDIVTIDTAASHVLAGRDAP